MSDMIRSKSPGRIPSPRQWPLWSLIVLALAFLGACSSDQSSPLSNNEQVGHSINADLRSLKPSSGTLSPAFDSTVTAYLDTVPFTTDIFFLTPTVSDSHATVKVNGEAVTSGSASANALLAVGVNAIPVVVTAQDTAVSKVYTVSVYRTPPAKNAALKSLVATVGTLAPVFDSATLAYVDTVPNATQAISLSAVVADTHATIKVNGTLLASGGASSSLPLQVGSNAISVVVSAQDTSIKRTYTLNITRAASSDASLSGLAISSGTLSPAFDTATTAYTTSVDNATTSFTVTPAVHEANASVKVNGTALKAGTVAVPLVVGANSISVVVTAQDGTTKTYTIKVTRSKSSDATLSGLTLSAGTLNPAFSATASILYASVEYSDTSITITPFPTDPLATIEVQGKPVAVGNPSQALPVTSSQRNIFFIITAQDGSTKSYCITVTRAAASTDASLSGLAISSGTLSPTFDAATTAYAASVDNATTSLTVTPTVHEANASVRVNGAALTAGTVAVPLVVGVNSIPVVITAQDGSTKTYTIKVTRSKSSDATLSALTLSDGILSPAFDPAVTEYAATVSHATTAISVLPTSNEATARVQVKDNNVYAGFPPQSIALVVGENDIPVQVFAQDGSTKTYTIKVTRS